MSSAIPVSLPLLLFYGGTFDPFHNGHLAIARAARDELQVPVHLLPSADPPHRPPPGANAGQRAGMLDSIADAEPGLQVDRRELVRAERAPGSRSYSVDTLRELRREHGGQQPLAWLIGADSFVSLPSWREWEALFGLAHFVVAERPGISLDRDLASGLAKASAGRWVADPAALSECPAGKLFRLHQPLQPESATEVRRRIASGQPWRDLVPEPVAGYIDDYALYARSRESGPV